MRTTKQGILTTLDASLLPLGFVRREATWNRGVEAMIDVVDIQINKLGDSMTMNCGVLHPASYVRCWGRPVPEFVEEPDCTVRARLGQLVDGHDRWWPLDDPGLAEDMFQQLVAYGILFVVGMHSIHAMAQFLVTTGSVRKRRPPETIYLASLKLEGGDSAAACALLHEFRQKAIGAWATSTDEILARFGCSQGTTVER